MEKWLGAAKNTDDAMTYHILIKENTVIARLTIHPANDTSTLNRRRWETSCDEGSTTLNSGISKTSEANEIPEDLPEIISSGGDITHCAKLPTIDPNDLVGYKFVREFNETPQRAVVTEHLKN